MNADWASSNEPTIAQLNTGQSALIAYHQVNCLLVWHHSIKKTQSKHRSGIVLNVKQTRTKPTEHWFSNIVTLD